MAGLRKIPVGLLFLPREVRDGDFCFRHIVRRDRRKQNKGRRIAWENKGPGRQAREKSVPSLSYSYILDPSVLSWRSKLTNQGLRIPAYKVDMPARVAQGAIQMPP